MTAITILQILSLVLVALAMAPALAHALELPGKLRLGREKYLTVQAIYHPGFTRAGMAEPAVIGALLVLTVLTPAGTPAFWLMLAALVAMASMQGIFWIRTQPANRIWVERLRLGKADAAFFATGRGPGDAADCTVLRDRWEHSHVARAACAVVALVLIATAVAL